MLKAQDVENIRDIVYDAAAVPGRWDGALKQVSAAFGAEKAWCFLPYADPGKGFYLDCVQHDMDGVPEHSEALARELRYLDPFFRKGAEQGLVRIGTATSSERFCSERDWQDSPWTDEILGPQGLRHLLALIGPAGPAAGPAGAPRLHFAFFRPPGAAPFGEAEEAMLQAIRRDLERAGRLAFQLRAELRQEALAAAGFERLASPALLLGADRRLLRVNASGEQLLRQGGPLRLRAGRVQLCDSAGDARLGAALAAGAGAELVSRTPEGEEALLQLAPLTTAFGDPAFLLLVQGLRGARTPRAASLMQGYGLSAAEAAVAQALAADQSLKEIAAARHVKTATVRTQLNQVFAKMGVSSQVQLARLLDRLGR